MRKASNAEVRSRGPETMGRRRARYAIEPKCVDDRSNSTGQ